MRNIYLGSLKDLHGATQSAVPTMCSVVTTGLSCLVLEIWPQDGQRMDGRRTTDVFISYVH